ncbi:MAG: 1-(5-phosphoribosyl)-5-[(5-phosphoribosylamino)methylideneamino]imidazole-4-carboxamide isomerase [Candidatus Dormibacteria bacterium]
MCQGSHRHASSSGQAHDVQVIPAIDLLGGEPVRLVQGSYGRVLRTDCGAVEMARGYLAQGARWLHVVDLDGAREGRWMNLGVIAAVVRELGLPVQAGGGVRNRDDVEAALALGVRRVIVSTLALSDPVLLRGLAAEYGDRLVVSLDSRRGRLLSQGWIKDTGMDLLQTARAVLDCGIPRLVYTDTERDGMLAGTDESGVRQLVGLGAPVMAAGGVRSLADLAALEKAGAEAAIVGRALFDGSLDPAKALARG